MNRLESERRSDPANPTLDVRVTIRDPDGESTLEGAYVGQTLDALYIRSRRGLTTVRVDAIERIEKKTGSQWATGLLVGGAIDLALLIAGGVALSSMHWNVLHESAPR